MAADSDLQRPQRWIIGWAKKVGWFAFSYVALPSIPFMLILAVLILVSSGSSKVTHDIGFPLSLFAWLSLFWTIAWFNRSAEKFFDHVKKMGLFDQCELEQKVHDVRLNQVTASWAALLTAAAGAVVFLTVVSPLSTGFTRFESPYSGPLTVAMDYTSWPYLIIASTLDFALVFLVILSAIRLMRTSWELMDVSDRWRAAFRGGMAPENLLDSLNPEIQAFVGSYSIMVLSSELTITLPLALLAPVLLGQASTFYHNVLPLYFLFLASYLALTVPTFVVAVVPMNDLLHRMRSKQLTGIRSQIADFQRSADSVDESPEVRSWAAIQAVRLRGNVQEVESSSAWPFRVRGLFDVRFIVNTAAALIAPIVTTTISLGVHF